MKKNILILLVLAFLFSSNFSLASIKFIKFNGATLKVAEVKNIPFFVEVKNYRVKKSELLNPEEILRELKKPLKIENIVGETYLKDEFSSLSGIHIRFKEKYQGEEVFNGYIDLHINYENKLYAIFENIYMGINCDRIRLNESDCIDIATKKFKKEVGKNFYLKDTHFCYYIEKGLLTPSYFVSIGGKNTSRIEKYVISLINGKILFKTSNFYFFDGSGKVFYPNPVNSLNNITLRDMSDSDSAVPPSAYKKVTLPDISKNGDGKYILSGPNVNEKDIEYPYISPPTSDDGSFLYTRSNPGFEAVMTYYWIDKACRYLKSLGYDIYPSPLNIDPHGVNGQDQSHFSGGSNPYIAYGDGGVDDAEDADIILHEMGHSIQYFQNSSAFVTSGESGAIGEGFSDYWAFSNTYNISVQNGFDPFCIGEWDSTSYSNTTPPCLRRVDSNKKYPDDMDGEIHDDGEIWSSCLREIFMKLGKEVADTVILEGQYIMPPSTNFRNGALSIIEADKNVYNGSHIAFICNVFYRRGILTEGDCRSNGPFVEIYNPHFSEIDGNGDYKADPGEVYSLNFSLYNAGSEDTDDLNIKVTTKSNYIKMYNNTSGVNTLPSSGSIVNVDTPFIFKIDKDFPCGRTAKFYVDVYNTGIDFQFEVDLQVGNTSSTSIFEDDFESENPLWQTAVGSGSSSFGWKREETQFCHSQTHSYYAFDPPSTQDSYLILGPVDLSNDKLYYLHFFHTYSFETGYDGGVVEISTDGGNTFLDLGDKFIQNGYDGKISDRYGSPIGGRMAFTGGAVTGNLKESIVDLSDYSGNNIYIRFRAASDTSTGDNGWYLDDVSIEEISATCLAEDFKGDLNGDGNFDSEDVVILKNILTGNIFLSSYLKDVSDITKDGKVNILDLEKLLIDTTK